MQEFLLVLFCFAPHILPGFPAGLYPVGFKGKMDYTWWISGGLRQALPGLSGRPCVFLLR